MWIFMLPYSCSRLIKFSLFMYLRSMTRRDLFLRMKLARIYFSKIQYADPLTYTVVCILVRIGWSLLQNFEETIHSTNDTSYFILCIWKPSWLSLEKKIWKTQSAKTKKCHFPAPPILNIFSQKYQECVLGWVGQIDVSQPIWLSGCWT